MKPLSDYRNGHQAAITTDSDYVVDSSVYSQLCNYVSVGRKLFVLARLYSYMWVER